MPFLPVLSAQVIQGTMTQLSFFSVQYSEGHCTEPFGREVVQDAMLPGTLGLWAESLRLSESVWSSQLSPGGKVVPGGDLEGAKEILHL